MKLSEIVAKDAIIPELEGRDLGYGLDECVVDAGRQQHGTATDTGNEIREAHQDPGERPSSGQRDDGTPVLRLFAGSHSRQPNLPRRGTNRHDPCVSWTVPSPRLVILVKT